MAKQTEGFLGGFNGKLGPVVGYRWKGIWCMRSQSRVVNNPRTAAQQEHRALFKAEVQLAGRMRWALNLGFKAVGDEVSLTPMNLFVKVNQGAFGSAQGRLAVDYAALQVSGGPVAPVALTEAVVDEDNVLNVKFEKNPLRRTCAAFDNVYFWVYNEELQEGYLSNPVYRRAQRVAVALPDELLAGGTPALHIYAFAMDAQGRCSETAYVGVGSSLVDDQEGAHLDLVGAGPVDGTVDEFPDVVALQTGASVLVDAVPPPGVVGGVVDE